jgi:hypothetical protein
MKIFRIFDELLRSRRATNPVLLVIGAAACYSIYGVAAGFFQGGTQIAVAMMKVPLIIFASVVLCVPSLYVFATLAGAEFSGRAFASALTGFCGIAALILLALMPVTWLFSVSTLSLGFVVWMHLFAWIAALAFGRQFLLLIPGVTRAAIGLWLTMLFLVALQMTTYVRPVLWRAPGAPLFEREKKSFFTHLHEVGQWKPEAVTSRTRAASAQPAPLR